jgi:DNA-binding transcriptional ArsR family regulator
MISEAAVVLNALGQETRLRIFLLLRSHQAEGLSARELGELAGVAPPLLSHHIKLLTEAGLIAYRREGRFRLYEINDERLKLIVDFLSGSGDQSTKRGKL